ncbi:hypothetical protein [Streptomyces sp. NPDC127112]|uniref:hypothetical protein n=1 Tax=Streptomyces sp. NPDC127112 TaxID=3345364 RepID=UPI00363C8149
MSAGSIARRSWRAFIGAGPAHPRRTAERGREGYTLWQRIWASFIGFDLLPTAQVGRMPARRASAVIRGQASRAEPPRNGSPNGRPDRTWFTLPPLPGIGGLTAAGGDTVVLEALSPDGEVTFLVRRHGTVRPEYSLELVSDGAGTAQPLVSTVKYPGGAGGSEQVLLVPVVRGPFGPAASYVRLPGFAVASASEGWTACAPVPVASSLPWDTATVAASVRAALNEATRNAWRQVRELVGDDVRAVIDGELR